MKFTFIDLFAGIGGFHAALTPVGGRCVFASEIDAEAAMVYRNNWISSSSKGVLGGDIKRLTESRVIQVPKHEVLTAGFPCQPFSKSGNQLGVNEARGTLFFNILKIIESRQPQAILLENVRNLVGPKHKGDFNKMIRLLRQLGYAVSDVPTILSPHELPIELGGTPQHRQRLFIGALRVGKKQAETLKGSRPLLSKDPFAAFGTWDWNIHDFLRGIKLSPDDSLEISNEQKIAIAAWEKFLRIFRERNRVNPPGFPMWSEFWNPRIDKSELRLMPSWKQDFVIKNHNLYSNNQKWIDSWRQENSLLDLIPSYRKFEWQASSTPRLKDCLIQFRPSGIRAKVPNYVPTFVAITQTPILGWEQRALSIEECLVLQGFPRDFNFKGVTRGAALRQIGNSVHPGVAQLVFRALVDWGQEIGHDWSIKFGRSTLKLDKLPNPNDYLIF